MNTRDEQTEQERGSPLRVGLPAFVEFTVAGFTANGGRNRGSLVLDEE